MKPGPPDNNNNSSSNDDNNNDVWEDPDGLLSNWMRLTKNTTATKPRPFLICFTTSKNRNGANGCRKNT